MANPNSIREVNVIQFRPDIVIFRPEICLVLPSHNKIPTLSFMVLSNRNYQPIMITPRPNLHVPNGTLSDKSRAIQGSLGGPAAQPEVQEHMPGAAPHA